MSRRSTRGRRQGVIRKGVIRRQEDSGTSCSLESSFNIFYTRRISDIENELPQDATAEETMERAIMIWRHMSLRERSEWDHLANCKNQQYMDKNRIVSYFGISEKISSPLPSSKCSKRCYDDSDDDDDDDEVYSNVLFCIEEEEDRGEDKCPPPSILSRSLESDCSDAKDSREDINNNLLRLSLVGLSGSGSI